MPRLFFTVGIPGSGKSTLYKAYFSEAIYVSSDQIRQVGCPRFFRWMSVFTHRVVFVGVYHFKHNICKSRVKLCSAALCDL